MELLVIEHGTRRTVPTKALLPGKQGNLQTLAELLPIIRRDVFDESLREFALDLIADCDNTFECQVSKLFEFAKSIRYVSDPIDGERIADAWTTIKSRTGDCGDKSELLASMLSSIGYLCRLRALNFYDDLEQHGYDHLLVRVQDDAGAWQSLDATPEDARPDWEPHAPVVTDFDIWPNATSGLAGPWEDLIAQGIQIGTQYAAGALQHSNASHAQQQQLGQQFDSLAGQVTALFNQIQSKAVITEQDLAAAVAAYQQLAQVVQQYGGVSYITEQWNSPSYKQAYESRLQQIANAVQQVAQAPSTSGTQQPASVLGSMSSTFSNPLAWAAVALLAIAVVRR